MRGLRISLTDLCNYRCLFCHNEGLGKAESKNRSPKLTAEMIEIIALASEKSNVQKIILTGGEPLVNKEAKDIVLTIHDAAPSIQINLTTNLILLKESFAVATSGKIHKVNVNFQSSTAEKFERMTGVNGIKQVKENIAILKRHGLENVSLNYVYTRLNAEELRGMIELSEQQGVDLKILEVMDINNVSTLRSDIGKAKALLEDIGYSEYFSPNVSDTRFQVPSRGAGKIRLISAYCNTRNIAACTAHEEIRLSPDLYLRPCIQTTSNSIYIGDDVDRRDVLSVAQKILQAFDPSLKICP
ncbi:MAG: radical SAM protein [Rhodospirillales bacterium]|nr:radical SAM protein [Rhodospirillales bacterium]